MQNRDLATVYIVDDDLAVRDSMRALLESYGMAVRDYPSARMFLNDDVERNRSCLLLDNQMPGMTGLELLQVLHARNDSLPVIMITGNSDPQLRERAQNSGVFAVLDKPVDDATLVDYIETAIGKVTAAVSLAAAH